MDAKIRLWLVMALMSISAYPCTDCCSCLPNHAQKAFCNSNVVIQAKFLSATYTDMVDESFGHYSLITYEIEALQVFKGGAEIQNLRFIYTSTLYYCEYYVSPSNYKKEYLITGLMSNGRVDVIFCNYIMPWSQLSEAQKMGIDGAYNCICNICSPWECGEDTSYSCKLNSDSWQDDTELKDEMCALNENGECTWQPVDT